MQEYEIKKIFARLKKLINSNCDIDVFASELKNALAEGFPIDAVISGYDIYKKLRQDSTIMTFAEAAHRMDIIKLLIESGASKDIPAILSNVLNELIWNPVSVYRREDIYNKIESILDWYEANNVVDEHIQKALNNAFSTSLNLMNHKLRMDLLTLFIEHGAEISYKAWNALFKLLIKDNTEKQCMEFRELLNFFVDHCGDLSISETNNNAKYIYDLVSVISTIESGNFRHSSTPINYDNLSDTLAYGVDVLVSHGADINKQDIGGQSALHKVCFHIREIFPEGKPLNWLSLAECLILHGARIDIVDKYGDTPIEQVSVGDWGATRRKLKEFYSQVEQHRNIERYAQEYADAEYIR